jgi:hypothetical protein
MLAELIRLASLIIWDEAFMTHIIAFEALDRTLHDLLSLQSPEARKLPFGGKVVLGGDPRQILPVVENGNRSQIVDAAITNSSFCSHVTILHLTANMRLSSPMLTEEARDELTQFSKWVLDIGEGNILSKLFYDTSTGAEEQYRCGSFVGGAQIARGVGYEGIRWTRGFTWFGPPLRNTLRPRENRVVLLCLSARLRSSFVYLCVCVCVLGVCPDHL